MLPNVAIHCRFLRRAAVAVLVGSGGAALDSAGRTLVATGFETAEPAAFATYVTPDGPTALHTLDQTGTIDSRNGPRSRALTLKVDFGAKPDPTARAGVRTPAYPVSYDSDDLAPLSLGFDLWVEPLRPVRVYVQSLDSAGQPTGARVATVKPPVAGAFYRHVIDLEQTETHSGRFDPRAPAVRFGFELAEADRPAVTPPGPARLRVDNLAYTGPAYYVGPGGRDDADGRTPATALATPQRAIDLAQPGDVVLLLDGTYRNRDGGHTVHIAKAGRPDQWIVLRAAPGHRPVLTGDGWNVVALDHTAAYIEIRGLTVRGNRRHHSIEEAIADGRAPRPNPAFNTNGIGTDGRKGTEDRRAHHIRYIANTVYEMGGGGLSVIGADHVTIVGNLVYDNAHTMRYAGSGISLFRGWNFDTDTGYKNFILGNTAHGNRCYVPWTEAGRISDGNGIIVDDMINYQRGASRVPYTGRTLVQNNLAYHNGGSGIHVYAANHVDIVNNTAYHNAQSPELVWRQIFAGGRSRDVHIANNILYAQHGRPLNFTLGHQSSDISYTNNLVFGDGDNDRTGGGGLGAEPGRELAVVSCNVYGDPLFVRPSTDPAVADFRLAPGSPARGLGTTAHRGVPLHDLRGHPRPHASRVDAGAYEH
jgi:hypothetical protein